MVRLQRVIPRYSDVIALLMRLKEEVEARQHRQTHAIHEIRIQRIWHKYFGGIRPFPVEGAYVEEWIDIAEYTNEYQFPLDFDCLNMYWEADILEQILHDVIPYRGFGMNKEMDLCNLPPHERSLVYSLIILRPDLFDELREEEIHWAEDYWLDQGRDPAKLTWLTDYEGAQVVLERLPYPFNGLWLTSAAIHRNTGNLFLDTYGGWDENLSRAMWWTVENINFLAEQWNQIHEKVTQYRQYKAWFELIPNAEEIVIEKLFNLKEEVE